MKFLIDKTNKVDFHIHTDYSDGVYSPSEIVDKAINQGLECIAFTDHNSDEARKEIKKHRSLKIIPGCEISVISNRKGLHLLAYKYNNLFNYFALSKINEARSYNYIITLQKACKLIHLFGGVAIIAHPFNYGIDGKELIEELLEEKCLDGIECIHPSHTQEEIDYLLDICEKNDLIVSAGSDFHYKNRSVREIYNQTDLTKLPASNSTVEEQLIRARNKYNKMKR